MYHKVSSRNLKACYDKLSTTLPANAYNLRIILSVIFYFMIYCLFLQNTYKKYQLEKTNW